MAKNAKDVVEGEALNLIVGGRPLAGEEKDAVKANVLKLLDDKYGVEEEDFLSAELEIVPAGKARDMGFDRSMILGYGHDDRVCAYPSMMAVLDYEGTPDYTLCCIITDKEEIGSVGRDGHGFPLSGKHCRRAVCLHGGLLRAGRAPLSAQQPHAFQRRERGL